MFYRYNVVNQSRLGFEKVKRFANFRFSFNANRLPSRKNKENIFRSMRLLFDKLELDYIISKALS